MKASTFIWPLYSCLFYLNTMALEVTLVAFIWIHGCLCHSVLTFVASQNGLYLLGQECSVDSKVFTLDSSTALRCSWETSWDFPPKRKAMIRINVKYYYFWNLATNFCFNCKVHIKTLERFQLSSLSFSP